MYNYISHKHYTIILNDCSNIIEVLNMPRQKTAADERYNERRRAARAAARAEGRRLASDEAYNARRRLQREAARVEKQAAAAGGVYGERLGALAGELRDKASNLYSPTGEYRQDLIRQSQNVRGMSEERQTDILLSSNIGSRIYAGTKEIWKDVDPNKREDAIIKAFGVRSMLDVLKVIENQIGELLYSDDTPENYDIASLTIMAMVA